MVAPVEFIPRMGKLGLGAAPRPEKLPERKRIKKPGETERKVTSVHVHVCVQCTCMSPQSAHGPMIYTCTCTCTCICYATDAETDTFRVFLVHSLMVAALYKFVEVLEQINVPKRTDCSSMWCMVGKQ